MKRYLMITLILIIAIAFPVMAKQENISLGPYKATFDLNITEPYNISFEGKQSETFKGTPFTGYQASINGSEYLVAIIQVVHYDSPFYTKYQDDIKAMRDAFSDMCNDQNIKTVDRLIDGHNGLLSISNNCGPCKNAFLANYWIDEVDGIGNTTCVIVSTFPWDNGTLSLLKTIHIKESTRIN